MSERKLGKDSMQAMMAKSKEKLTAARRDLADGYYGEAASRSYYAVFHALSAVLASDGLAFSSHSQALGGFNKHFVKTGIFPKETTRSLQRLFEDRQIADYDWITTVDAETGREDVEAAEQIVEACAKYLDKKVL
jgi:uncharacterized protein (UPF0332 family)